MCETIEITIDRIEPDPDEPILSGWMTSGSFIYQPERSKREDSMDKIYDEIFKRSGIWFELSREMRCSEHDGNAVRDK